MNINLNPVDGACIILGHVFRDIKPEGMGRILGFGVVDGLRPTYLGKRLIVYEAPEDDAFSKMTFLCHEILGVTENSPIYHKLFSAEWNNEATFEGRDEDIEAFTNGFFNGVQAGIEGKSRSALLAKAKRAKEVEAELKDLRERKNQPPEQWGEWYFYSDSRLEGLEIKNFQIIERCAESQFLKIKTKKGMVLIGDINSGEGKPCSLAQTSRDPWPLRGIISKATFNVRERSLDGGRILERETFLILKADNGLAEFRWTQKFWCDPDDPADVTHRYLLKVHHFTKLEQ